jgi:threonine/homoserine/homoserine lactone efflux protein
MNPLFEIFIEMSLITLGACIPLGPMTILIIHYARLQKPLDAVIYTLGILLADICVILLIMNGLGGFFENPTFNRFIGIAGGIFLLWIGIAILRSEIGATAENSDSDDIKPMGFGGKVSIVNGLFMSVLNPTYWLWWGTVGAKFVSKASPYGFNGFATVILALIIPTAGWFSFLYIFTVKGSEKLKSRHFHKGINLVCGIVLIGFGIWFLVKEIPAWQLP